MLIVMHDHCAYATSAGSKPHIISGLQGDIRSFLGIMWIVLQRLLRTDEILSNHSRNSEPLQERKLMYPEGITFQNTSCSFCLRMNRQRVSLRVVYVCVCVFILQLSEELTACYCELTE